MVCTHAYPNYSNNNVFIEIICVCTCISATVISQPCDAHACEGREAVFMHLLNSNIRSDDVQWYRFIKDTNTTVMVYPDGDNINFITDTNGNATSSSLTITNVIKSYAGYFWVGTPSLNVCNASLTVLTRMYIHTYSYVVLFILVLKNFRDEIIFLFS